MLKVLPVQRRSGFTLIELLVVIAVIALLAAILFPVFARARENARRSSCQSNLKQMGIGVMQYVQDYDEYYPYGQRPKETSDPNAPWVNSIYFWPNMIQPYIKSEQVFSCPNQTAFRFGSDRLYRGHYGANRDLLKLQVAQTHASFPVAAIKMSELASSASVFMAFDAGIIALDQSSVATPSGYYYIPGFGEIPGKSCPSNTTVELQPDCESGRHFGGVNMLFADGHVKWLLASKLVTEANKTAQPSACTAGCTQYLDGAWNVANEIAVG